MSANDSEILLQSILAMDSYNRMTGGLKIADNLGIGSYRIVNSTEVNAFAAVAYQLGNGNPGDSGPIVISFRGTDNTDAYGKVSDIWSGWLAGVGDSRGSQIRQAIDFYKKIRDANPGKEIVLTGHSLGGGLAGLVATIYGKPFFAFDNMPFEEIEDIRCIVTPHRAGCA